MIKYLVQLQGSISGTLDILAILNALNADSRTGGVIGPIPALTEIDNGFEIYSTAGTTEAFTMNSYGITIFPRKFGKPREP